jgi:membrane peptidoglycan carboxypeptidase
MLNRIAGEPAWTASGLAQDLRIVALRAGGRRPVRRGLAVLGAGALAALILLELRTGWLQSQILTSIAAQLTYSVEAGPSRSIRFPASGPYDHRLGHASLPAFQERLARHGFEVTAQARISPLAAKLTDLGLYPIYPQKTQAGLLLADRHGLSLYEGRYPERMYAGFESIPPVVIESLLFVENREILDLSATRQNPAVEWARLGKAFVDLGLNKVHRGHPVSGGSTLATQLEKVRHSPEGRTSSLSEKARQMASASLRAYQDGEETVEARRRIVRDYLNSLPLAALPGYGEVQGLGDGLWAWFGADFDEVNRLLWDRNAPLRERAAAYRQALSLLLAIRKPSVYLRREPAELDARTDSYLRLLASAGTISPELRDAALAERLEIRERYAGRGPGRFADRKAADAVRTELLRLLGVGSLYDLDRLDLRVSTTIDSEADAASVAVLQQLADPQFAARAGITGYQLLSPGSLDSVIYSFTLYERTPDGNVLRVLADNYDQPLNINEGTKLELGSTAKLRTLVTYLEVIAELHAQVSEGSGPSTDRLTRWALDYLRTAPDRSLGGDAGSGHEPHVLRQPGRGVLHRRGAAHILQLRLEG